MIVRRLELRRRNVSDRLQQPTMIEPVDPFKRGVFHCLQMPPRTAAVDDLGLVEPDNRFRQRVVVRIANAAHRGLSLRCGQALGVANRQILTSAITMMDDALCSRTRPQCLLQRVQDQFGVHRARHAPADDAPCEDIDDERDVDETAPRRYIREIGHPQLIGMTRLELALDQIERPFSARIRDSGAAFAAAHGAPKAQRTHQALDGAARDYDVLPAELPPHLASAVDVKVLFINAVDLRQQRTITLQPRRQLRQISLPRCVLVVLRWGNRQLRADRLDPVLGTMGIDKRHHHFGRRSSSAWAKKADALRKISFARFNSRFSRSSSLSRSRSVLVTPARRPWSRSACRTHLRSVSAVQPIFDAIEPIAAHCESYSASCSNRRRTARSRTSGEYLFDVLIDPILSRIGVSGNPGAVHILLKSATSL